MEILSFLFPSSLELAFLAIFSPLPAPCQPSFSLSLPHLLSFEKHLMFYSYMYEVARRNPFVFAPVLLNVAARFEEAATMCCEQQQKATCFQDKVGTTLTSSRGQGIDQCQGSGASLKIKHHTKPVCHTQYHISALPDRNALCTRNTLKEIH